MIIFQSLEYDPWISVRDSWALLQTLGPIFVLLVPIRASEILLGPTMSTNGQFKSMRSNL